MVFNQSEFDFKFDPKIPVASSTHPSKHINSLPQEVLLKIFSYLNSQELNKLEKVCRYWKNLKSEYWLGMTTLKMEVLDLKNVETMIRLPYLRKIWVEADLNFIKPKCWEMLHRRTGNIKELIFSKSINMSEEHAKEIAKNFKKICILGLGCMPNISQSTFNILISLPKLTTLKMDANILEQLSLKHVSHSVVHIVTGICREACLNHFIRNEIDFNYPYDALFNIGTYIGSRLRSFRLTNGKIENISQIQLLNEKCNQLEKIVIDYFGQYIIRPRDNHLQMKNIIFHIQNRIRQVNAEGLIFANKWPNMRKLFLSVVNYNAQNFATLVSVMPYLTELEFVTLKMDDLSLQHLTELKCLKVLSMTCIIMKKISIIGIRNLIQRGFTITNIKLNFNMGYENAKELAYMIINIIKNRGYPIRINVPSAYDMVFSKNTTFEDVDYALIPLKELCKEKKFDPTFINEYESTILTVITEK